MKKALLTVIFLASGTVFASENLQVYYSLDVQEQPMSAPKTELKYKKSVGGLTCVKTNSIIGGDAVGSDKIVCSIVFSQLNSQQIYYSLNVQEQPMSAPKTELKYKKSVGGLTCVKTNSIIGGDAVGSDKVDCSLQF